MSFTRKILDGARSGLSSLLEKVSTDDTPLSYVDEHELDAELAARLEVRKKSKRKATDNPRAKHAGASAAHDKFREQQAAKRGAKVNARRKRRRKAQEQATEQAYRQAEASARRQAPRASAARRSSAAGGRGKKRRRAGSRRKPDIAAHYETLNLPPTASMTEAKRAFRKLMRKFHPDLAPKNKKKAATEITMGITAAYNAIEEYHSGK